MLPGQLLEDRHGPERFGGDRRALPGRLGRAPRRRGDRGARDTWRRRRCSRTVARCFVTRELPGTALDRLRAAHEVEVWPGALPPSREELIEHARDAEGLLCLLTDTIDADVIAACPRLRAISNYAVGSDNIDTEAAAERGIEVAVTPDVLTDTTADLAFALMLAAARRLPEGERAVRGGRVADVGAERLARPGRARGDARASSGMGRIGQRGRAPGGGVRHGGGRRSGAAIRCTEALAARRLRLDPLPADRGDARHVRRGRVRGDEADRDPREHRARPDRADRGAAPRADRRHDRAARRST